MLVEKSLKEFTEELKANTPTPGGGGVAALNAALGAAQIMMVANHTIGKEKYAEYEDLCKEALEELEELRCELLAGVDADAEAFGRMAEAYKLPTSNEAEKDAREIEIANAALTATSAPLAIMQSGVKAMEICEKLLGRSNPNLESDLKVAALSLDAGIRSAKFNVGANMAVLKKKDQALASATEFLADELLQRSAEMSARIIK
ncbi:MAG: cyclodeaminase/cyclohydrolase family protein [Mogibacterium sp.]|nr:cyclodeaminase/cyclohydrolase family protein [Mogibacterium sp.]